MPNQKTRLIILMLYVAVLFIINYFAFGIFIPSAGSEGLWFYAGLLSILLGNLIVTPYFTKPADAFAYAVAAGITLFAINNWTGWNALEKIAFILTIGYCFLVLLISVITILCKDHSDPKVQRISSVCRTLSDVLGSHTAIFSVIMIFSIVAFHRNSPRQILALCFGWVLIAFVKPELKIFRLWEQIKRLWKGKDTPLVIGDIAAYQSPGMILIRQKGTGRIKFGTPLIFKDEHAPVKVGVSLDYIGRDEGLLLRAIEFELPSEFEKPTIAVSEFLPQNTVAKFRPESVLLEKLKFLKKFDEFVGIVAPETSIDRLYFEVIRENDLEEGRLVAVAIREAVVLYQVLDGLTREEIIHQKNTFGYARAKAKKIGIWNNDKNKFIPAKWLPRPNEAVYLKTAAEYAPVKEAVGHFPGTNYSVSIKNVHDLVTHNTAILGILGIGKSMLAIELIERMIAEGIKVICLDLTNQYAKELAEFYNADAEKNCIKVIQDAGVRDQDKWAENPEEGGSLPNLTQAIRDDLEQFLNQTNQSKLKIYNPAKLFAKKQISDPRSYQAGGQWQRSASLWSITPVEITKIVTEGVLDICQTEMTDKARACLVFEEAHSLVPEWGTVACEGDKSATNATARAILQGRKYGLGCILISQRTANVTKSILNQCNTIFAMRTFDDTGKEFLSNYIGNEHASILSSIYERYAVFFGKASSCENPVLLRLNDRDDFKKVFRNSGPAKT